MNLDAPVSTIMTTQFTTIPPETSIGRAEKIMFKKGLKLLAVEDEGIFKGLVTSFDCKYFRESLVKDGVHGPDEALRLKHHKVSEIMNTRLVRLSTNDKIKMASEIMKSIIFQVIPVVEKKKLLGILTSTVIQKCSERQNSLIGAR